MIDSKSIEKGCEVNSFLHSSNCYYLLEFYGLYYAIEYCKVQGLKPPACSLKSTTKNAHVLRGVAARKLTSDRWWYLNLVKKARQDSWMLKFRQPQL